MPITVAIKYDGFGFWSSVFLKKEKKKVSACYFSKCSTAAIQINGGSRVRPELSDVAAIYIDH